MNILSLDLSTKSSGWAVFKNGELFSHGCITASSTDLIKRIHKMTNELQKVLDETHIDKIIVEEVRPEGMGKNNATHRALMWLQAALAFLIHDNYPNTEIEYIYPSSWRAAIGIKTGRGIKRTTLKESDIEFVKEQFGLEVNDDEADAICIGFSKVNKLEIKDEIN